MLLLVEALPFVINNRILTYAAGKITECVSNLSHPVSIQASIERYISWCCSNSAFPIKPTLFIGTQDEIFQIKIKFQLRKQYFGGPKSSTEKQ